MVTFRNNNSNSNNRRPPFRSNNTRRPPFRSNSGGSKFSNNDNFQRKVPGRNNHNAAKLIEKYNEMAREALVNEDRVLSESYFQYADHFTRVQNEQESLRMTRVNSSAATTINSEEHKTKVVKPSKPEEEGIKKIIQESSVEKVIKAKEKKSAVS